MIKDNCLYFQFFVFVVTYIMYDFLFLNLLVSHLKPCDITPLSEPDRSILWKS